jgi:hypothetical protein
VRDDIRSVGPNPTLLAKCIDYLIDGRLVHGNLVRTRAGKVGLVKHPRKDL